MGRIRQVADELSKSYRVHTEVVEKRNVEPPSSHDYTTSFISNIEHNYITTTIVTQHWDGWNVGGQKNNLIVVHPHNIN